MYSCGICKTKKDQISHHKAHLETEKHKDKRELFELKLTKLNITELKEKYETDDIKEIVDTTETITHENDKKLKNTNNDEQGNDIENIMCDNMIISNKEALCDKIHEIHNYLRNNGAGYGMNALKVFNVLYGLKKIEDSGLIDKIKLKKPDCVFSHLVKLSEEYKDDDGEKLSEFISGSVLESIYKSDISDLLFYEIPKNMNSTTFKFLIKEINKITQIEKKCNVLLSGKIYEYFIGRDESAISELGAYFTDRHIVDYIYNKLKPELNKDNSVKTMVDMFGGSGGFTTGYLNYLNQTYSKKIDWSKEINKIYHYDMNDDVIKSAGLEFFCLTGQIPNMKENLQYKNSFRDEFNNKKYDYVITNPPYGGDKSKQGDSQIKREKLKKYILEELKELKDEDKIEHRKLQLKTIERLEKQEKKDNDKAKVSLDTCSTRIKRFAKKYKLTGNDKESCSLILMMDMVKEDGTCIGVLKEGVFFNKTYKDLRKCLINNFNVREVISVPQDQFENTSTKTSIVIFNNTKEKTKEVKFYDLSVERYAEDKFEEVNNYINLTENKGDIKKVSDKIISSATLDELNKNVICSLNGKDYNKKVIKCGKDFELKKLCEITELNMGSTPDTKNYEYWENGDIPWVCVAELNNNIIFDTKKKITKKGADTMKNRKIPIDSILLSFKLSIGKIAIAGVNMYCNEAIVFLNAKDKLTQKYLYHILNIIDLKQYGRGTIGEYGNLNKYILENISIPIPKSEIKLKEWVDKISKPYDEKIKKQNKFIELETKIQDRIKEITEDEDCEEVELGRICEINNKNIKRFETSHATKNGKYIFHTGATDTKYLCDEYNIDKYTIIFNKTNGSGKCNIFLDKYISCAKQTFILQSKNETETIYIYYYLCDKKEKLEEGYIGACHKNLSGDFLQKFKIKIPTDKKLINKLELQFKEIEKLQKEIKDAEILYNKYIKELSEEATPIDNATIN